jgi:hypothetical protein
METMIASLYEIVSELEYEQDEDGFTREYYEEYDTRFIGKLDIQLTEEEEVTNETICKALVKGQWLSQSQVDKNKVYLWSMDECSCKVYNWNHKPLYEILIG